MKTLEMVGLNQIHDFTLPEAARELPSLERDRILHLVFNEFIKSYSAIEYYFPILELIFLDWVWKDAAGKTLPQRIDKVLKEHNITLSSDLFGSLGNDIRETIPVGDTFLFDIVTQFRWRDGAFHDGGSCMFHGRREVKDEMEKDGRFYALRFFSLEPLRQGSSGTEMREPVKKKDGITFYGDARCWLFSDKVYMRRRGKVMSYDIYLVFNSYGKPLREMASIFAAKVGGSIKKIKVSNLKKMGGGLYVNGPGFIVGPPEAIENMEHLDFGMKNEYDMKLAARDDGAFQRSLRRRAEQLEALYKINSGKKKGFYDKKKKSKKRKNRDKKHRRFTRQVDKEVYYTNRSSLSDLLFWNDRWTEDPDVIHPMTTRHYWRTWYNRLREDYWAILIKILSYRIKHWRSNDKPKSKSEDSRECEAKHTKPSLRGDERTLTNEDRPDSSEVRFDTVHDEIW